MLGNDQKAADVFAVGLHYPVSWLKNFIMPIKSLQHHRVYINSPCASGIFPLSGNASHNILMAGFRCQLITYLCRIILTDPSGPSGPREESTGSQTIKRLPLPRLPFHR